MSTVIQNSYLQDVVPILEVGCIHCHRPVADGGLEGFEHINFSSYETTRPWSVAMAEVLRTGMIHGDLVVDGVLTEAEAATIIDWREGGSPRGSVDGERLEFDSVSVDIRGNSVTHVDFISP